MPEETPARVNDPSSPPAPRRRVRRCVGWLLVAGGVVVACCSVLGLLGGWWWPLDLLAPFRLQYAGLLLPTIGAAVTLRAWRSVALLKGALLLNAGLLLPLWLPASRPTLDPGQPCLPLRVLQVNVLHSNWQYDAVRAQVATHRPHVVVTQELTDRWSAELRRMPGYRPASDLPWRQTGRLMVWVREDVELVDVAVDPTAEGLALIVCEIALPPSTGPRSCTLVAAHPPPGVKPWFLRERRQTYAALGDFAARGDDELLVVGDLNATRWSAPLRRLLGDTDLRDSTRGFGPQGTWPARLWFRA